MKKACKCCCLLFLCQCFNRAKPLYGTNVVHTPFQNGLPKTSGTTMTTLASNPEVSGEFYAVNNRGLFISTDLGLSWRTF